MGRRQGDTRVGGEHCGECRARGCAQRLCTAGPRGCKATCNREGASDRDLHRGHSRFSSSCGALAGRREFAREGLVSLAFVNSISRVVPWGGRKPVYGTNPMAFAVPRENCDPLVFDQASSVMAHGEIRIAAQSGHELPAGVGVDRSGEPTTNPQAIVDGGALLPFGGHKGSSIAMMIE